MPEIDHIVSHDNFASNYDNQAKEYHSHGHDVLFGMCYEYLSSNSTLLDLGIGTGLSSANFAKAGLKIIGLDGSAGMLHECEKKDFACELQQYDITNVPYPFNEASFTIVICCSVFHFFADFNNIVKESHRLLDNSGILAFTIAAMQDYDFKKDDNPPLFIKTPTVWGIPIYKHSDRYINEIAETAGFSILKEQKLLIDGGDESNPDLLFKAIVMQKV